MTKGHQYGYVERTEVIPFVPEEAQNILEVGCSRGGFAAALRRTRRPLTIWGIDSDPRIETEAAPHYDRLIIGLYPQALTEDATFDCIVFNDVLEHMPDPWEALTATHAFLPPNGAVVASIPNVRYLPVVGRLLLKGDFTYTETGVMDRTHLRFFTKKTTCALFAASGYEVVDIHGINPWRDKSWLVVVMPRPFEDMVYRQFVLAARPQARRGRITKKVVRAFSEPSR
jgi:2-polyprenyl-3-methyl-5-hydroxy-6-metoxy-1,4-benzoquinol methylase